MNKIDYILSQNAKKYMIQFDLDKFKRDFPRLYITFIESMKQMTKD